LSGSVPLAVPTSFVFWFTNRHAFPTTTLGICDPEFMQSRCEHAQNADVTPMPERQIKPQELSYERFLVSKAQSIRDSGSVCCPVDRPPTALGHRSTSYTRPVPLSMNRGHLTIRPQSGLRDSAGRSFGEVYGFAQSHLNRGEVGMMLGRHLPSKS
jgi:hypothetical protein